MSRLGYRDDSPYNHLPYIDIHTNNGIIDMSATGKPLMANGRYLPPYSGQHQFNTNIVREIPINKKGGYINKDGMYVHKDGKTTSKPGLWSNVYMKNKKQMGGYSPRLVTEVPKGYVPIENKPNYYHNPQQSQSSGNANGTLASNADWNAFLASPKGMAWKQNQQSDDIVYTQPQIPTTPQAIDPRSYFAQEGDTYFNEGNQQIGAKVYQPIRNGFDQFASNNLNIPQQPVYYQPTNRDGQNVGEGFMIPGTELNKNYAGKRVVPNEGFLNKYRPKTLAKQQIGVNNFKPVGSTILPGNNVTQDKSLCPPGFAFIGNECVPINSTPEANIGGQSSILPAAKTDYVTQQYNTDAAFKQKYDESIANYKPTDINKKRYTPDIKTGIFSLNAIAGIAGKMYDNNYKMANARRIQADSEYNPAFSYGPNDYGVAKKGGFLQHLAEGGDVDEFDAYEFLFNDEDDDTSTTDDTRTTTEDIEAAAKQSEEFAAMQKENEELRAQSEEQEYNNLAIGEAMRVGWKAPTDSEEDASGSQDLNYSAPTNSSESMNVVKEYYQSKGYEPEFIAGVLGNISAESNGRSDVNEASGGGGYGLFQHTGPRRTQLVNFAKSRNMSPADPIAQAMFAEQEPDFQNAHKAFQKSPDKSPGKAAVIFEQKFERAGIKRYGARIGAANAIYQSFKSGGEYEVSDTELQDLIRQGIQFQMI